METKEIVLISLKRGTPGRGEIIVYYSGGDYEFLEYITEIYRKLIITIEDQNVFL